MPLDPITLGAITSGATSLFGTIAGNKSIQQQNAASREFSREMYEKTKNDNLSFWNQQNEYNSPSSMMKRFQEAGLNPNMIYGSGPGASAASPIKSPDVQSAQFRHSDYSQLSTLSSGVTNFLNAMADLDIKKAQTDNLRVDNTVKLEQAALTAAQTNNTLTETQRKAFDLQFEKGLEGTSADYRREALRQAKLSSDKTLNDDQRAAAANAANLQESAQRVLQLKMQTAKTGDERQQIKKAMESITKDIKLKQLDIELKQKGIQPSDPLYMRVLGRLLEAAGIQDFNSQPKFKN